jgi:hypothetical protein
MPETTLTPKSVRFAEDDAKWLSTAAAKGAVTQNDLLRLALNRLRNDLGGGEPDQARNRPGDRQGVQVQAHPTPSRRREGASGHQAYGPEWRSDVCHRRAPRSGHACSQELIAAHRRAPASAQTSTRAALGPRQSTASARGADARWLPGSRSRVAVRI